MKRVLADERGDAIVCILDEFVETEAVDAQWGLRWLEACAHS